MTHQFRGSYAVTITPFTEDGSAIDYPAWTRFLDWQLAEGVPGLIILGTTGEFLTLTDAERTRFIEETVAYIDKRVPVLVGTMNAYTPNAARPRPRPPPVTKATRPSRREGGTGSCIVARAPDMLNVVMPEPFPTDRVFPDRKML